MNYISTRGSGSAVKSVYAAASIYAKDGGLYVPEKMPRIFDDDDFICLAWLSHSRRYAYLNAKYMRDVYFGYIASFGDTAFAANSFRASASDLMLRALPLLFEYSLAAAANNKLHGYGVEPDIRHRPLLVIPSNGVEALALADSVKELTNGCAVIFYPAAETSEEMRSMFMGAETKTVLVCGVDATLDEISHSLAKFMKTKESAELSAKHGLYLMRGDTQSWFGIVSYAAYFMSAYCEMIITNQIRIGDWVDLVIDDTFEMAAAAFYAKQMGLKAEKIICEAPADSPLHTLIKTARLDPACARDGIFIPPALERLLYAVIVEEGITISDILEELGRGNSYALPDRAAEKLREAFCLNKVERKLKHLAYIGTQVHTKDSCPQGGRIYLEDIPKEIAVFMQKCGALQE